MTRSAHLDLLQGSNDDVCAASSAHASVELDVQHSRGITDRHFAGVKPSSIGTECIHPPVACVNSSGSPRGMKRQGNKETNVTRDDIDTYQDVCLLKDENTEYRKHSGMEGKKK